jgi:hypothetical protein
LTAVAAGTVSSQFVQDAHHTARDWNPEALGTDPGTMTAIARQPLLAGPA